MLVIKIIKKITGLTQEELANFLGVSRASINSWENSQEEMTAYQKRIITEKFNIPMRYLEEDWTSNYDNCKKLYILIQSNWNEICKNNSVSKDDMMINLIESDLKTNEKNISLSDYDIIEGLSEGFNPYTGEIFDYDHILNDKKIKEFLNNIKNKYFKFMSENKTYDDLSQKERNLFEELREWRREKTFQEGFFSAYMIFNDRELINIITASIKKKEDLLRVKGIGEIKYNKYSDEIYHILCHNKGEASNEISLNHIDNSLFKTDLREKNRVQEKDYRSNLESKNVVKSGKSVKVRNINTGEILIYNIVNVDYHYEPRYGSAMMGSKKHYVNVKVCDTVLDVENNEISSCSDFYKVVEGKSAGYKFYYKDDYLEIIEISDYVKSK